MATDVEMHDASGDERLQRRTYLVGVGLLLLAAVLWSFSGALIKLTFLEGRGPGGVAIAFYRSLFAGVFLLPLAWGKLHTVGYSPRSGAPWRPRPAALCGVVFFSLMAVFFVVANTKTEAANAIILQYTSTFWVFGLSPWILREKPRAADLWLLGFALTGIAIIFLGNAATDLAGLMNALGAGLFFGLLTLMIRRLRDTHSTALTVMNNLGSALLILPIVLLSGDLGITARSAWLLLIMGVVQIGIPYCLFAQGLARVPAHQAALVILLEPVLVPLWTYLAVDETVSATTALGGGVILLALACFLWRARRVRDPAGRG